eukprot:3784753-Rhodomonas_salina.1
MAHVRSRPRQILAAHGWPGSCPPCPWSLDARPRRSPTRRQRRAVLGLGGCARASTTPRGPDPARLRAACRVSAS